MIRWLIGAVVVLGGGYVVYRAVKGAGTPDVDMRGGQSARGFPSATNKATGFMGGSKS